MDSIKFRVNIGKTISNKKISLKIKPVMLQQISKIDVIGVGLNSYVNIIKRRSKPRVACYSYSRKEIKPRNYEKMGLI